MLNTKTIGLGIMVFAVFLFVAGFGYVRSAEQALLEGHTIAQDGDCQHEIGSVCPFEQISRLVVPKFIGLFLDVILFAFGVYLFLQKKPEEKLAAKAHAAAKELGGEEAKIFEIITQSNGMAFQHELVQKLNLSKVRVTRLLDKLEAKGLVERRRRGMTNIIVLR